MLIGMGHLAWWLNPGFEAARIANGLKPSHYDGPVPLEHVRELFSTVSVGEGEVSVTYIDNDGNEQTVIDESRKAILNRNNGRIFSYPKGAVYDDYNVVLCDRVNDIVQGLGDVGVYTAGLFDDQASAFLTVGIPETMRSEKIGLTIRPNLLAAAALDGTLSRTYKSVVTVVECDNTFSAALAESGEAYKVKNSKYGKFDLTKATDVLGIITLSGDEFLETAEYLADIEVSDEQWSAFLDIRCASKSDSKRGLTVAENKRDLWQNTAKNDARCSPWFGTAFGVVQTGNTIGQHLARRNGGEDDSETAAIRADRNVRDAVTGKVDERDADVLATLYKVLDLEPKVLTSV